MKEWNSVLSSKLSMRWRKKLFDRSIKIHFVIIRADNLYRQEVWIGLWIQRPPRVYVGWAGFKGINFRCSNSILTEKWLCWGKPITFLNSQITWLKKGMGSHSLWVPPWGLAQGCKSLWGNKIMIQHIGVGKTSVTGHHWPAENLVSFCYRLSSPEAEAETEIGVPDIFRDQHLPRERGRSRIG